MPGPDACDAASAAVAEGAGRLVELLPPEYTRPVSLVGFHAVVVPKALGSQLLKLLASRLKLDLQLQHLKRVRAAAPPAPPGSLEVLLCPSDTELPGEVTEYLQAKGCGAPATVSVPRFGALTRSQLAEFSVHWPLTYRKPALEPLELSIEAVEGYGRLLQRAAEVGAGACGCVIVDPAGKEIAAAREEASPLRPLRHAAMAAIESVAAAALARADAAGPGGKRPRAEEEYLCQDCEVVTTHEPCVMCAMALVHSRVRLIVYRAQDPEFGGLGGAISLHTTQSLNHQFRVLRWVGP